MHLHCLAETRSCLAALADLAKTPDISAAYERMLIDFDAITGDVGPATYSIVGVSVDDLVERAESALDRLAVIGVDALSLELLIGRLHDCRTGHQSV